MAELQRKTVEEFRASHKIPLVVVLENIRSGYNVGSMFRTADAFLLEAVYICGYSPRPPHKEIRKTALGAEDSVAWQGFPKAADAIESLRAQGYAVYALEQVEGSIALHEVQFGNEEKLAVVLGNEVTGVEQETVKLCDGTIEIPQLGMKHSLNVATAGGVVLWELVRSRINPYLAQEQSRQGSTQP
jgi:tRNA G18 (ribose-2'-O)-methylase SpoU